ncbi:hypothetical protein [Paractinoplanes brasiliensis]|uniref:hypothetical protein n=1 Tax=Paractinoplanes brasiliensis TaxID=52695 RepID=UPI001EF2A495|nr:hypothetical protein [Actinoplanes brasiliensis]
MIVIDVLRVGSAADRAHPELPPQQLVEVSLPDPIARPQVVFARAAIKALPRLLPTRVVARLAVAPAAAAVITTAREVVKRLGLAAVRTVTVAFGHLSARLDFSALLLA